MKYINNFKSISDFNNDKEVNQNQPRVALVKEMDRLFYFKFKIYEFSRTQYLNGMTGNYISIEDIPVKTNVQDMSNDDTLRTTYLDNYDVTKISHIYPVKHDTLEFLAQYLTVTSDSLDLIEIGKLITKFTLTGLKRKDNGQRDFVGEIACYLDSDNKPFLFKVDRTNSNHPTVTTIRGFDDYKDTYEIEKRTKGVQIYFEHL